MLLNLKKILIFLAVIMIFGTTTYAYDIPYNGYTYNSEGDVQPTNAGYIPIKKIYGNTIGTTDLSKPNDIFCNGKSIYILDSGNNRIIITDMNFKLLKVIDKLHSKITENVTLSNPTGIFVSEKGFIYIADQENKRVLKISANGEILYSYEKPNDPKYDQANEYKCSKVLVDNDDNVYILVDGIYEGALIFQNTGEFIGYYGANKVQMSLSMIADQAWKKFMTQIQRDQIVKAIPAAFSNFDIDDRGFVYTTSVYSNVPAEKVKKFNPSGISIMDEKSSFGDPNIREKGNEIVSKLNDCVIVDDKYLAVLDGAKGKVFQYDSKGMLLFAFGGSNDQIGNFNQATAIEGNGDYLYILDSYDGSITVLELSDFGKMIHKGNDLYNEGLYQDAVTYWQKVIKKDAFYELAYNSIGRALFKTGDYNGAMENFKMANNKAEYSVAFQQSRVEFIRAKFAYLIFGLLFFIFLIIMIKKILRKNNIRMPNSIKKHFIVLMKPFDTVSEMVHKKDYSVLFSIIVLSIWVLLEIALFFEKGFIFNSNRIPDGFNILFILGSTVGIYMLAVVSNWLVTTLIDGKGTLKAIWVGSSYVLVPYIFSQIATLILSNVFTLTEGAFISWIASAMMLWSILILVAVMSTIHEFEFGKVFFSLALTVIGIAIILFLFFMCFALFQRTSDIFQTMYNELVLRQ